MNANRPVAALVAATTLLSSVGAAYGAQHDDLDPAAIVAVGEAGSAAGLARACSVDPQPIAAAVAQLFRRLELDPAAKAKALARYRANEAQMTANVRDQLKAPFCADRYLLRRTVHDLNTMDVRQPVTGPTPGAAGFVSD
jgi:hypothetical protein